MLLFLWANVPHVLICIFLSLWTYLIGNTKFLFKKKNFSHSLSLIPTYKLKSSTRGCDFLGWFSAGLSVRVTFKSGADVNLISQFLSFFLSLGSYWQIWWYICGGEHVKTLHRIQCMIKILCKYFFQKWMGIFHLKKRHY